MPCLRMARQIAADFRGLSTRRAAIPGLTVTTD
jgi:hypothetical protein